MLTDAENLFIKSIVSAQWSAERALQEKLNISHFLYNHQWFNYS